MSNRHSNHFLSPEWIMAHQDQSPNYSSSGGSDLAEQHYLINVNNKNNSDNLSIGTPSQDHSPLGASPFYGYGRRGSNGPNGNTNNNGNNNNNNNTNMMMRMVHNITKRYSKELLPSDSSGGTNRSSSSSSDESPACGMNSPPYEMNDLVFVLPSESSNSSGNGSKSRSGSFVPALNLTPILEQRKEVELSRQYQRSSSSNEDDSEDFSDDSDEKHRGGGSNSHMGVPQDQIYITPSSLTSSSSILYNPNLSSNMQQSHDANYNQQQQQQQQQQSSQQQQQQFKKRAFYDDIVQSHQSRVEQVEEDEMLEIIQPYKQRFIDDKAADFRDLGTGINPARLGLIPRDKRRRNARNYLYEFEKAINLGKEPGARFPIAVILLTCAQVAVLLACFIKFGMAPILDNLMLGPPLDKLNRMGGKDAKRMRENKEIYRLISAFIFHSGILHILFTLLWQLGLVLVTERSWGWFRILSVYLLSGIGGNLMSSVFLSESITIGATSCLIGILSALIAEYAVNYWVDRKKPWKPMLALLVQVVLFLAMGYLPTIDNYANFGGVVCGFLSGLIFAPRKYINNMAVERIFSKVMWGIRLLAALLLIAFYAVLLGVLLGSIEWKCKVCYLLSPSWENFPEV